MQSLATIDIIAALAKTFIIILPGYIVTKLGIINSQHTAGMSSLITCVTYPCLVITAMQMEFSMQVLNNCKYVVLIFLGAVVCALQRVEQHEIAPSEVHDPRAAPGNRLVFRILGPLAEERRPAVVVAHREVQLDSRIHYSL